MEQASLQISGSPADVLLDPLALPSWNEAFLSIDGPKTPVVGQRYRLRARPGLTGWLEYTTIPQSGSTSPGRSPASTKTASG
jgi:hypothetical protein